MAGKGLVPALALLAQLALCATQAAEPTTPLDRYLDGLHSLRVSFSQSITDAQGHETDRSSGEFLVLRPERFRWDVRPATGGSGQLLVADGKNLWYYDRDLQQVTVKPMSAALSATPAMLLSGGGDVRASFDVRADGKRDGLDWVRVTPRTAEADFRDALLGFSGKELRRMILKDKLGQTATLAFERAERNATVSESEVSFAPPPDADLIGVPAK
ncbi:MAG: outer membrane lipoprotein chaperone LolA [Acetobacteraceae bacterium]|nr:outer membrane lipoprotein chaperone LolA [Acetobacteraceae bacterium]